MMRSLLDLICYGVLEIKLCKRSNLVLKLILYGLINLYLLDTPGVIGKNLQNRVRENIGWISFKTRNHVIYPLNVNWELYVM
jgi:hypothetical protein